MIVPCIPDMGGASNDGDGEQPATAMVRDGSGWSSKERLKEGEVGKRGGVK